MENTISTATRRRQFNWPGLALVAGCMLLVALAVWMLLAQYTHGSVGPAASAPLTAAPKVTFEEATGVHLRWVAVTAGGGMIDLRYQVLDPDKAQIVHDQKRPPKIIDEATGRIISRPWMDHGHKRELRVATSYHQLLLNAGGIIKRGSPVTVVIGEARLEHIVVQ